MRIRNTFVGAAAMFLATAKVLAQDARSPADETVERDLRDLARRDRSTLQACYAGVEQSHAHAWRAVDHIEVALGSDGAVGHVTVHGTSDVAAPLEACVNRITSSWHLRHAPPAARTITLSRDQIRAGYMAIRRGR